MMWDRTAHQRLMSEFCPHGARRDRPWPKGLYWMERIETCGCCGTVYACLHGHVPENCCTPCGGREMTLEEAVGQLPAPEAPPRAKSLQERLADFKVRKGNVGR